MSLSQRLRKLSREYGWSALGVYLLLSAIDFPLCFVAVRFFGAERIGHIEHVIVGSVRNAIAAVWPRSEPVASETASNGGGKDGEQSGLGEGMEEKENGEASMLPLPPFSLMLV